MSDAETTVDLLLADRDDWRIHSATVAGRDEDRIYLLVLRSRVGDSGLLMSLRYYVVDPHSETGFWGSDGIEMLVNGPLTQALARMFAAADNGSLAGEQGDVLTLDARGNSVESDPEELVGPIGDLADSDGDLDPEAEVECVDCGGTLPAGEAVTLELGETQFHRHREDCSDD